MSIFKNLKLPDEDKQVIAGVCYAIANAYNMNVKWVRILALCTALFTPLPITIVYIIMAIVLQES